jgi:transposase-like protein
MATDDDTIEILLRLALEVWPESTGEQMKTYQRRVCQELGGGTVYVRRAPAEIKFERLRDLLGHGVSLSDAASELGVSRMHVWRLRRRRT